MKTTPLWQVRRTGIVHSDGARRWDDAYQFLLQWAMEYTAGERPAPSHPEKEASHGTCLVCPRVDQPSAADPDN